MFWDVFASFAFTLVNIFKIREDKKDNQAKSIIEALACSSKKKDNVGSSEEDTIILERDPSKEGTSKKNGNVTHNSFF
jgi:hypothetical protein